jgi:hypothetical protein
VLAAVQQLIIPIQCEYYGLEGISQLLNTVRLVQQNINPGLAIGGVLLTMYDSRLNLCRQVAEDATEYFGPKVFATPIPRNVRLAEAPSFGKPILLYDAQSVGAKSYLAVAQELMSRVEGAEVTIAPAQVAAATAHAAAAAAVVAQPEEPASAEGESGEAVAADSPVAVSSSVEEETPASSEEGTPAEVRAEQETVAIASSDEIVPEGDVAEHSVQEVESLPEPEFAGAVQADGSHDSAAEISEQVSVAAPFNGTDPVPIERADDEANRQPHQSSESNPR